MLDQSHHCETQFRFIVAILASAATRFTRATTGVVRSSVCFAAGIITMTSITTRNDRQAVAAPLAKLRLCGQLGLIRVFWGWQLNTDSDEDEDGVDRYKF